MVNERLGDLERAALRVPARDGRPALDLGRNVHCMFGLVFDDIGLDGAVAYLRRCAAESMHCFMSTPNLNFAIAAQSDPVFRASVQHSDLSVVDGMTILRIGRMLGLPMRERVAGSDVFERLRRPPADGQVPMKVYFFGGPPGVAQRAAERINGTPGGVVCVGFESPGFGSVADMSGADVIERINASGADFVVVALGAKKGQAWIEHNRHRLRPPLVSHLGAVVNFVAGSVKRAPQWLQNAGFEWLWRIKEEPALWRRYAADGWALLRFLATEVGPSMWHTWRAGPVAPMGGHIEVRTQGHAVTLRLRGHFGGDSLHSLRHTIARALQHGSTVQMDLREATQIDSAFLAIALLLESWQGQPRAILSGSVFSERVLSAFNRYGARSLLDD
jgi:N-acetylglucosaminyldiphosphoundecaprenol N-acetyl-beta-D-mannosaminyltransferase